MSLGAPIVYFPGSGGSSSVGTFVLFSDDPITGPSGLPSSGQRQSGTVIIVEGSFTDPQTSQPLTTQIYFWDATLAGFVPFSLGIEGSGTLTSLVVNNGLWINGSGPGTITTSGSIGLANIASNTLLGNTTGLSGLPVSTTLTAMIDAAIGNTWGSILARGPSNWYALAPGFNTNVLTCQGAGANVAWLGGIGTWSTHPATSDVNMGGHSIYSLGSTPTVSPTTMTIGITPIASSSSADVGTLSIIGGQNQGSGYGGFVAISGGQSFTGPTGTVFIGTYLPAAGTPPSTTGSIILESANNVILAANHISPIGGSVALAASNPSSPYQVLCTGATFTQEPGGISCNPIINISSGTIGWVLTSAGDSSAPTFQALPAYPDLSQWSTYPAVSNVNMGNFGIYSSGTTQQTTPQNLTIALSDLAGFPAINQGNITISCGTNNSVGNGGNIFINSGEALQTGTATGSITLKTFLSADSTLANSGNISLDSGGDLCLYPNYFGYAGGQLTIGIGNGETYFPNAVLGTGSTYTDSQGNLVVPVTCIVATGGAGLVLTTIGGEAPPTFQPPANWAEFPADQNVNLNGQDIYSGSGASSAPSFLMMALDSIFSGGSAPTGTLTIYGGDNLGAGQGGLVDIVGGSSSAGLSGNVYLQTLDGFDGTLANTGTISIQGAGNVVIGASYDGTIPGGQIIFGTTNSALAYNVLVSGGFIADFPTGKQGVPLTYVAPSTAGYVFTSTGPTSPPSFQPIPSASTAKVTFLSSDWAIDPNDSNYYLYEITESMHGLGNSGCIVTIVNTGSSPAGNPSFFNTETVGMSYDGSGNIQLRVNASPDLAFSGYALIV